VTGVPVPRSDEIAGAPAVLSMIAATVARVETKVDNGFDSIRREYVPRIELDPRLKSIAEDIVDLKTEAAEAEKARIVARRWLISLSIPSAVAMTDLFINHFH
jgi:transcriptional regulator with AAA-type ATPase domain